MVVVALDVRGEVEIRVKLNVCPTLFSTGLYSPGVSVALKRCVSMSDDDGSM